MWGPFKGPPLPEKCLTEKICTQTNVYPYRYTRTCGYSDICPQTSVGADCLPGLMTSWAVIGYPAKLFCSTKYSYKYLNTKLQIFFLQFTSFLTSQQVVSFYHLVNNHRSVLSRRVNSIQQTLLCLLLCNFCVQSINARGFDLVCQ